jgi:hypothetical protein
MFPVCIRIFCQLKQGLFISILTGNNGGISNKELPPNFGKAKVREFAYCKNFAMGIFCLFSASCELENCFPQMTQIFS